MANGLLSDILNFIDQKKQSTMAGLGLLANNPQEYFTGRTEQLRDFNRAQEAGLIADRNQIRGLPVTPEQQMAQQYANQQLQDVGLGFTGNIKPIKSKPELMKIYRGSYEESPIYKVEENYKGNDIFGGVFGSPSLSSAQSHGGGAVHYTEIPKNKILTQNDLSYQIPFEDTKKALLKARPDLKNNSELFDEVYNIVINDSGQNLYNYSDDFIKKAFKTTDFGEAGFEAQRLRGQVSKNLGYKAVEVMDEHGTSYLVAPGSQFKKVKK